MHWDRTYSRDELILDDHSVDINVWTAITDYRIAVGKLELRVMTNNCVTETRIDLTPGQMRGLAAMLTRQADRLDVLKHEAATLLTEAA